MILAVSDLTTRYGAITALHGVSLDVAEGEVVALVGPNGAGKTTLLNSIAGLLRPAAGEIRFAGEVITRTEPATLVRRGLALVPEHRRIFKDLTVLENLRLAGITASKADRRARLSEIADLFPVLRQRWEISAGYLSGGEAQQLAIGRALMADPKLLLLDEPTLGLAPTMTDMVYDLLGELRSQGRTMLVVDQNARRVLELADRGYVMRSGRIVRHGDGTELLADENLFDSFLGGPV